MYDRKDVINNFLIVKVKQKMYCRWFFYNHRHFICNLKLLSSKEQIAKQSKQQDKDCSEFT